MNRTIGELNGKHDSRDMSTTQCDYKSCNHINIFKKEQEGLKIYYTIHSHFIACTTAANRRLKIVNTRCHQCGGRRRLHSCLHCVYFGCYNGHVQDHHARNDHYLYADLTYGNILCMKCGDYDYDDELTQIAHKNILETARSLGDYKTASICRLRPLANFGNTCFMNSIMQILVQTPLLRIFLLTGGHRCSNSDGMCLMCEFTEIFKNYYCGEEGLMGLSKFLYIIYRLEPRFADGCQHDTQEFLLTLLGILDTNCITSDLGTNCITSENDHSSKNQSVIHQLFKGLDHSDISCLSCGYVSTTNHEFWDIQLDVDKGGSLLDCLRRYTNIEDLDSVYLCSNCNSPQQATKQLLLRKIPIVLTLNLKRFERKKGNYKKLLTEVEFPEVLDMSPFMTKIDSGKEIACNGQIFPTFDTLYVLYGVVEHLGAANGGHYLCFVRLQNDFWYKCNDHLITRVALEDVLASQGYLLFYHKKIV